MDTTEAMDAINLDDLFYTIGDDHHVVSSHTGGGEEGEALRRMRAYSGDSGDSMMDEELDFDIPGDIFECDALDKSSSSRTSLHGVLDGSCTSSMHSQTIATSAAGSDTAAAPIGGQISNGVGVRKNPQDVVSRRRSSFNIDRMVTVASRGPRTARVNPYLAMREQEQQQQGGSQQRELSSLQTTWNNVDVGGKRRRRKSKRFGIDYDDDSNEDEDESGGGRGGGGDKDVMNDNTAAPSSKRSRRSGNNSSSPKIVHSTSNSHRQERDLGKLYSQSQQGYNQSTQHPMSVVANAQQQQYLQQYEKEVKGRKSFNEYGLSQSRSKFFPFINLPNEVVDVKKRGKQQRVPYRCLEKISSANVGGGIYKSPTTATGTVITKDSPIYKLFGQHIGVVDTESGEIVGFGGMCMSIANNQHHLHSQHSPATSSTLITSLTKSTEVVQEMVHQLRKSRQHEKLTPLVNSAVVARATASSSSPQQLVDDLVTLYLTHVRQAAFLRQNLTNMEYWCEDNYKEKDVREVCPVPRRNVEKVLTSLWAYKVHSYTHQQNQVLLDDGNCATTNSTNTNTSTNHLLMITINVKVKVKGQIGMPAFRDKSGKKLFAHMSCPKSWKVAWMRGAVTTTGKSSPTSSTLPKLDLSFADMETIKVVANETLRFDLLPQKIKIAATPTDASLINYNCPVIFNNATVKNSLPVAATKAMDYVKKIQSPAIQHKKEPVKKSKSDCATIVTNVLSISPSSTPYIPGNYHQILKEDNDEEEDEYRKERHRRVRALYGSILYPDLSLAERCSLLAKETSITSVRQKQNKQNQIEGCVANSSEMNRIDVIDRQIMELQEFYLNDIKMTPETCSTIGLWSYMTKSNYFDGFERKKDVHFGLEGIINQSDDIVMKELEESSDKNCDDGHSFWGSISEEKTNRHQCDDQNGNEAISPIYERLHSLLVEEDSGDDDEETDDDDYDILTKLSSYSPEEFTHGLIGLGNIDEIKNGDIATLDLSSLTLDHRTYIQLCLEGLIDTKRTPYSSIISSCSSSSDDLSSSSSVQTISEDNNDNDNFETGTQTESVDSIVHKMLCRLAVLNVEAKEEVSKLRRLAFAYIDATSKSAIAAAMFTQPGLSSSPMFQSKTEDERSGETKLSLVK